MPLSPEQIRAQSKKRNTFGRPDQKLLRIIYIAITGKRPAEILPHLPTDEVEKNPSDTNPPHEEKE